MNEIIRIEDMELERVEYNGQPVLTLAMVDKIHQKPDDT
ncbi:MAG: ORF6N domain-containing protein, partial [Deltaproteobacteria bacterium]|nr:ORF6N domain-containing protein [Deltaproteobacteria bacterium]